MVLLAQNGEIAIEIVMVITLDGAVQLIVDFIHDHIDVTGVHEYIFIRRDVRGVHMVEPAVADGAHRLPRVVRVGIRLDNIVNIKITNNVNL